MDAVTVMRPDRLPAGAVLDLLRSLGLRDPHTLYALAVRLPGTSNDGNGEPARAARVILGEWFARVLNRADLDAGQAFLLGRAAFVAIDGASRYADALMADEPAAEFCTELLEHMPQSAPPPAPAAMPAQPLEPPALLASIAALFRSRGRKGANHA